MKIRNIEFNFVENGKLTEAHVYQPTFNSLNWSMMLIRKKLYDNHAYRIFNKHQFYTINAQFVVEVRQCSKNLKYLF